MTTETRELAKKAGGFGVLTVFILGANWGIDQFEHRQSSNQYVTRAEHVIDSARVASQLNSTATSLAEILRRLDIYNAETNQRLREICEGVRRGCR